MNLEDLNKEYVRLFAVTEQYKSDLEQYKQDLKKAQRDKVDAENNINASTTKSDKKKYQKDLADAENRIDVIKEQIKNVTDLQRNYQGRMDIIIGAVQNIPAVKDQCTRAIAVRTERQIEKFEKQKKEQEEKKSNLDQLKNLINRHPQATTIVNTIENKTIEISKKDREIKEIDEELSKLNPSDPNYATDKARLDAEKVRLDGEKTTLTGELQTERNNLKKLFNNSKLNEEIDKLTTRAALDKDINRCDRLINRSNNKIHDYKFAKDSLNNRSTPTTPPAPPAPPKKWDTFKGLFSKRTPGAPSRWEDFKSLFKKRPALPPAPPTPTTPTTPTDFKASINLDGKLMSFDVVQAAYKKSLEKKVKDGESQR